MSKSSTDRHTKPGPARTTGPGEQIVVRVHNPLLAAIEDPARRATLIARREGAAEWQLDIRLQGAGETVFLEI